MPCWVWFLIGMKVGGVVGAFVMAAVVVGKRKRVAR